MTDGPRRAPFWSTPAQIAFTYLVVAVAWILVSDSAVESIAGQYAGFKAFLQSTKGTGFVVVTAIGLYLAMRRRQRADQGVIAELADREGRLRFQAAVLAGTRDAITVTDGDRRMTYWNEAAEHLFGIPADQALGRTMAELVEYEIIAEAGEATPLSVVAGGGTWRGDARVQRPDGATVRVEVTISPITDSRGRVGRISSSRDVTAVRRQSETLETMFRASPLPVILLDADQTVAYWNEAAERLFGFTAAEMLGTRSALTPPDEADAASVALTRLAQGEPVTMDVTRRAKDGSLIPVRLFAAPVRNDFDERPGVLAYLEDLRERQRLESDLRQAQKMEAVGRLAGGIAHDFNNILTAIGGYARLLEHGLTLGTADVEDAREVIRSADRATRLTRQLLAFSRRAPVRRQVIGLTEIVTATMPMLQRLVGDRVHLVTHLEASGRIVADPTDIEQIILNLVVNAADAMPERGQVTITTSAATADQIRELEAVALERGDRRDDQVPVTGGAVLTVMDEGIGMEDHVRRHVFEPFFTTKPEGSGTGLGLANVYGIVARTGGTISVESAPGEGTRFTIVLPEAADRETSQDLDAGAGNTGAAAVGHGPLATILLVEDDDAIRQLTDRWFRAAGYQVLEAGSGEEALARADLDTVDVVVTDVMMPSMTGLTMAQRLRDRQPDLPIVFMSGYVADVPEGPGLPDRSTFISKPMTSERLLEAVRSSLPPVSRSG
ncbi:MAG: PAS domain S-box protein [Chloroflexota bacterium]